MKICRAKDYDDMSRKAAHFLFSQVTLKPRCVLGLATGSSPVGVYKNLIAWHKQGDIDFSEVRSINLDEYRGLSSDNPQSYRWFMNENFFRHINIDLANTHVPNGLETDEARECARYDALIRHSGGIDMQLLGIGGNGHIGFNEPDASFTTGTHCVSLAPSTMEANKRFFDRIEDVPREAYTMGIRSIMQARRILLIASGKQKARAIKDSFFGPVTPQVPASILQLHPNVTLIADEAALSMIG